MSDRSITMIYRNYRGEVAERTIVPICVTFGATEYHPEPQWLMTAKDCDKDAVRDFALSDCDFRRAPITTQDAMTVPEVAALVMAARRARQEAVADEMDGWFADLVTALRAMEGGA